MIYLLEGEAKIRIGGKPHSAKEVEMIITPNSKLHAFKAVTPYEMLRVMIKLGMYVIYGQKGEPI